MVQGVAAAVVYVVMRPAEAAPSTVRGETARGPAAAEAVVAKSEQERREALRAKRRLKRQRENAARAAAAVAGEAGQGSAGNAATAGPGAVEGDCTPKRTTTPTFERGHTGLTHPPPRPPGKRQCLEAKDGDDEDGADDAMDRRLSLKSVASVASCCTVFTTERDSCCQRTSAEWGQLSWLPSQAACLLDVTECVCRQGSCLGAGLIAQGHFGRLREAGFGVRPLLLGDPGRRRSSSTTTRQSRIFDSVGAWPSGMQQQPTRNKIGATRD